MQLFRKKDLNQFMKKKRNSTTMILTVAYNLWIGILNLFMNKRSSLMDVMQAFLQNTIWMPMLKQFTKEIIYLIDTFEK